MDAHRLRAKMVEKNMNVAYVAEQVGICRTAMYRKLNKPHQLTIGEVLKLKELLKLTDAEACDIFLNRR